MASIKHDNKQDEGMRDGGRAASLQYGSGRRRRVKVEAGWDREWLMWIGRFRFVTAELLAMRFGVSVQQARARLRRLAEADLVGLHRAHIAEPYVAVLTPSGATAVGYPRRQREPRPDLHRIHELAIVKLVCDLELAGGPNARVLTERDCRRLIYQGRERYCVVVADERGLSTERWPDVVVVTHRGAVAFEIELAPKHTPRLARILRGYLVSDLAEVRFLLTSPALAQRMTRIAAAERLQLLDGGQTPDRLPRMVITAWSGATSADRAAIQALAT
jgi:hypothetical protein